MILHGKKGKNGKENNLYINRRWLQAGGPTGSKRPQEPKQTPEETEDLCKALMQNSKKKIIQPTTIFEQKKERKKTPNNNWAPSKIRLRSGAEVDKTITNQKKNTILTRTTGLALVLPRQR